MTKVLALAFAAVLVAGEEPVQLKVYVDGMSCPTGCAPKVVKALSSIAGATDVKLEDFDKGLFSFSLDARAELKSDTIQKPLGDYKVKKVEATVTGTIGLKDKEIVLTTAAGRKFGITFADCCADEKAEAKKDPAKKDDCEICPVALKAKVETLAKDGKTVKVTGPVSACCEVSITVRAIDEVKKATN